MQFSRRTLPTGAQSRTLPPLRAGTSPREAHTEASTASGIIQGEGYRTVDRYTSFALHVDTQRAVHWGMQDAGYAL